MDAFSAGTQLPEAFDARAFQQSLLDGAKHDHTRVYSAVFDPEGRYLAASTNSGNVHVWDVAPHLVGMIHAFPF